MQISDALLLDAAVVLDKAGPLGAALHDVASALWPGKGATTHPAAGRVLGELVRRGFANHSPGTAKRRRYALTDGGKAWLAGYSVADMAGAEELLENYEPRLAVAPKRPLDPVEAAIAAWVDAPLPPLPRGTSREEAYQRGIALGERETPNLTARLHAACRGDQELYQLALDEAGRRARARIAEIEAQIIAAGDDPFRYSDYRPTSTWR